MSIANRSVSLQELFSTPVAAVSDFLPTDSVASLEKEILRWEAITPGESKSNLNAWHSPCEIFTSNSDVFQKFSADFITFSNGFFRSLIRTDHFERYDIRYSGWANILRKGGMNMPHIHPDSTWSAVYYVKGIDLSDPIVDSSPGGRIIFEDFSARSMFPDKALLGKEQRENYALSPLTNQLIMFPSFAPHWVTPLQDDTLRISIAINMTFLLRSNDAL